MYFGRWPNSAHGKGNCWLKYADTGYSLETLNKKKEAWMKIQAEFNSINPEKPPRDGPQLKGLRKRIITKTKSDIDARQTGEGPPMSPLGQPEQILSEMFSGQFDPLPDTMDDDDGPFQEEPGEDEAGTLQQTETYETPKRPSKRKSSDQSLREELLKMAREVHEEKMKMAQLEHVEKMKIIEMKKHKEELRKPWSWDMYLEIVVASVLENTMVISAVQEKCFKTERKSIGSHLQPQHIEVLHLLREMELEVEIKEEPVPLEGTANTSLEMFELVEIGALKPEIKSVLAEPWPTQENTLEPCADIKEETVGEQHVVCEVVPHIKQANKNFMHTEECSSSSAHHSQYPTHLITDSDGSIFCCDECSSTFTNQAVLQSHKVTNHSGKQPRPHRCNQCNRSFLEQSRLKSHMATHSGERPYQCKECNSKFVKRDQLRVHMKIHSDESPYCCDLCNRKFRAKYNLIQHILLHSGEKPYLCNVCKRSFGVKSSLYYHMSIHSGIKPYVCNVCNKRFARNSDLRRHMLVHSEERPHECGTCNKTFLYLSSLKLHMLTHSGKRPYRCEKCKKSFLTQSNLRDHSNTHLEKKPYYCTICNRSFATRGHLITHLVTHSRIRAVH